jgi:hypothetical protein
MITIACLSRKIVSFAWLAFWLSACSAGGETPPAVTPTAPLAAESILPLGATSSSLIANAPDSAPSNEAVIDTVAVQILETDPIQVNAVVKGKLPDGCVRIERIGQERSGNILRATIFTTRPSDTACMAQLQPFQQVLPLDIANLPAGAYTLTVSGANSVSSTFEWGDPLPPAPLPSATPLPIPTTVPAAPAGSISGVLWADFCQRLANGAPSAGCIPDGQGGFRGDGTYINGEAYIAGVQVTLRPGQCPGSDPLLTTTTDENGRYRFDNLPPGPSCLVIDPLTPANLSLLPPGNWTYPAPGLGQVEVVIGASESKTADFGWDDQFDRMSGGSAPCVDRAAFVADVTIPDNTPVAPGASFIKTWRARNIGTCSWGGSYTLVFTGGAALAGPAFVPLPETIPPGGEVNLSVALVAPVVPGVYRGEWKLQNGSRGIYSFYVQVVVGEPTPPPVALSINGLVWEDTCRVPENGAPADGCVLDGLSGTYQADGRFTAGERGLAGVQVKLSVGECPGNNFVFTLTTTDANGAYYFAGVQPGPHCVTIETLTEPNASLLLPGQWTYPAPAVNSVTVIAGLAQNQLVDFGWDYE